MNISLLKDMKKFLLAGYYAASLPYRRREHARLIAAGRAPILVLFYHRIADDRGSPWTHTNQMFERQIGWLQTHCELISLAEAQRRIRQGRNDRLAACITFDDGYAENMDRAIPLLLAQCIPCTYFVSVAHVFEGTPFAHDLRRRYLSRPNTVVQLRWMARNGIEIGAHTRHHVDLGAIADERILYDEVVTASEELQDAVGAPVRYFSFPFGMPGNLNPRAFELAYEHGYEGVCSAYGDYNFPGDDAFHIRRIHADDMVRLKNWGTIDPRKLRPTYSFDYQLKSPGQFAGVYS